MKHGPFSRDQLVTPHLAYRNYPGCGQSVYVTLKLSTLSRVAFQVHVPLSFEDQPKKVLPGLLCPEHCRSCNLAACRATMRTVSRAHSLHSGTRGKIHAPHAYLWLADMQRPVL